MDFSKNAIDTKEGLMKVLSRVPIFSYNTIATTLLMPTKTLEIKFRKPFLNDETLIELESILAWASSHPEIQSLLITSYGEIFVQGFDPQFLIESSEEKLKIQFQKISTIAQSLLCLPQTVVVDMKKGARGIGIELSLAADIRIASPEALFCFDHLKNGLTPCCGLFSFLKPFINLNILRSLLLSGAEFKKESFLALGGSCEFEGDTNSLLANIFSQAPVARIQAKMGLYGIYKKFNQEEIDSERKIFNATLQSKDYTKKSDFMSVAEFKEMHERHN